LYTGDMEYVPERQGFNVCRNWFFWISIVWHGLNKLMLIWPYVGSTQTTGYNWWLYNKSY
jgi:hypothetical protein